MFKNNLLLLLMGALIIAYINTLNNLYAFVKEICPEESSTIDNLSMYTQALVNSGYGIFFDWCHSIIEPYKEYIMDCNEEFFLGMCDDTWDSIKKDYFSKFSGVWKRELSEESRVKLWWYFQQLIKIGDRVKNGI